MKLPAVTPSEENVLCVGPEDFRALVKRTLSKGNGAFFKLLGKTERGKYYMTLLIDDEKILAAEIKNVETGESLTGNEAVEAIRSVLEGTVVADAYPLDDLELKMSVVENIDVYNSTKKIPLGEIWSLGAGPAEIKVEEKPKTDEKPSKSPTSEATEGIKSKKTPKFRVTINSPPELSPYFRAMANHLRAEAKALGVEVEEVRIDAKEIRYALGAGVGVHSTIEIVGKGRPALSLPRLREILSSRAYKEAGEFSRDVGKKIVISDVRVKLT